jgi:hypothetical protein
MKLEIFILSKGKFERHTVEINENDDGEMAEKVIGKIKLQITYIINVFKKFQEKGLIKSLAKPRNKQLQPHIDELVYIKQKMQSDIEKIKQLI